MYNVPPIILTWLGGLFEVLTFLIWTSRFFAQGLGRWEGLCIHALACALFYLAWVGTWKHAPTNPKAVLGVLLSFFFPGIGFLLALVLNHSRAPSAAEVKALQEDKEAFASSGSPLLSRTSTLALDKEIQPIADVLTSGDMELKREAIRRLSLRGQAASVQLLKKALLDPHGEIRLYAINALSKIEGKLVAAIAGADQATSEKADMEEAWLRLGTAYRAYALSGLLEGMLQTIYLQKANRAFEKARTLAPTHAGAWVEVLKSAALLGRQDAVGVLLEQALFQFPEDPALHVFQAEYAFNSRRYREVQRAMNELSPDKSRQQAIPQEVTALWQT